MKTIMDDKRQIYSIATPGEGGLWCCIGREGVTRIVPYFEHGQMAEVIWFAVWKGDDIAYRINGAAVEYVEYSTRRRSQDEQL